MIIIDKRLNSNEMSILRQLIGKKIVSFMHDEFNFNNSSSQVVGIETELGMVYLYNFTEPLDYYGSVEDVAVWKLTKERYKFVDNKNLISSPVGETVKEIRIVQENQKLFENGTQTYNVWVTRGIIFDFGDHQFAFEKPVWFSEDIYVHKGYDLITKFTSTDEFVNDDWCDGCKAECERKIVSFG